MKKFILLLFTISIKCNDSLVNLESLISGIVLDLRYATEDNFTKEKLYPIAKAFLVEPAAKALKNVQADLNKMGYQLKLWDCYRPLSAQVKMWNLVPDERYVSNPNKGGGRHTKGTTVDCTLLTLDGKSLEMPTEFDDFTETASSTFKNVSEEAKKNREILHSVMTKHGFIPLATEWWHFDFNGWENYKTLDISLENIDG